MARIAVAVGKTLLRALLAVGLLVAVLVAGGQMGLLAGKTPTDLGVHDGRLKPAPSTPNCVNSQSVDGYARIAPLVYAGDGRKALQKLHAIVAGMPPAKVIVVRDNYMHAEFSSRWLGFVDDAEFYLDQGASVIHVRSASRLGRGDYGVNRDRVETLRAAFGGS